MILWPADGQVSHVHLGFRVADLDAAAANLDQIAVAYERPQWFQLRTRDPDGNHVHLIPNVDTAGPQ